MPAPKRENPQQAVDAWNKKHPSHGVDVAVRRDDGTTTLTKTRSRAEVLSGHTAVIWLEGISGCYMLSRVSAVRQTLTPVQAAD